MPIFEHKILSNEGIVVKLVLKLNIILSLCLISSLVWGQSSVGNTVIDDLNNKVHFDSPPQRIITLAPNLTEMIYELGVDEYLVGNTVYCNYPEAAKTITKVGDLLTFNYEKILSLKPDLVFITVEGNTKFAYDKFLELGIKLFVSNPRDYKGIKKSYSDLAQIFQKVESAERTIAQWDSIVNNIKSNARNYETETVMFLIELNPIMIAGKKTFLNEFIELCGMKNFAKESPLNYPVYSREEILNINPYYIVYPTYKDANVSALTNIYPEWVNLDAVKNNRVILLNWDLFSRPGPRFAKALKVFFNRLHP